MKKTQLKTDWDLSVFYKNPKDQQIEKDTQALEAAYASFAKKYQDRKDYLENELALVEALKDWERLLEISGSWRPGIYFSYLKALNSADAYADAQLNLLTTRLTKSANAILFFTLRLGKIVPELQTQFLKSTKLVKYRYYLKQIFETSKHDLTEAEEKIMNLKSLPAHSLWVDGAEKLLTGQLVSYREKGKTRLVPIGEAMSKVSGLRTTERRKLWRAIIAVLKNISHFAEAEINAIVTDKKINDELRGFQEPYSATVLGYQNDEATVLNLTKTVTDHFHVSARFYKLKAKLLKLKVLEYADRGADLGQVKKQIPFAEAATLVSEAFGEADKRYADIFLRYLANGQIDVFSKKGKDSGAFCSSSTHNPTFVLLNHADNLNSVTTIGHEMGHAIHHELSSQAQPVIYEGCSYAVAETASTFFENFVFEKIFSTLSVKEQIAALHDRINGAISTVFRQVAFFNFELELHREIRAKGALTKEQIAALLNRHVGAYLGPAVKLDPDDGYFFVAVGHFRRFFYVYSYAFGHLVSSALFERYKKDKNYLTKVEQFLSAGCSKTPEDIFKDIGIDVTQPEFFADGISAISADIDRLEQLAKRAGMI